MPDSKERKVSALPPYARTQESRERGFTLQEAYSLWLRNLPATPLASNPTVGDPTASTGTV